MIQPSTLDYALHYSSLGMRVFPLHYITTSGTCSCGGVTVNPKCKPGKHPFARLVPHGLVDASLDTDRVREWFTNTPYNIGLATGRSSGIFVLDRDDRDGGNESLQTLEEEYGKLPSTLSQTTGNGVHYLFQMPPDLEIKNSAGKLAPGIDIRGNGGYVVATPSKHQNGKFYTWNCSPYPMREEIAHAPDWLVNLALGRTGSTSATKVPTASNSKSEKFIIPDKVYDGQGREDLIVRYAGHLRGKGLDQSTVERTLLDYNQLHISPPLDEEVVLDRARRY